MGSRLPGDLDYGLGVDRIAAGGPADGSECRELWLLARGLRGVALPPLSLPSLPSLLSACPESPLLGAQHAAALILLSSNPSS